MPIQNNTLITTFRTEHDGSFNIRFRDPRAVLTAQNVRDAVAPLMGGTQFFENSVGALEAITGAVRQNVTDVYVFGQPT